VVAHDAPPDWGTIMLSCRAARRAARAAAALPIVLAAALVFGAGSATATGAQTRFTESDLVSDQPGHATLTDPNLVNPWGLAIGPATPLWVADNGPGVATVYRGGGAAGPITQLPLAPTIPDGAPTGQAFNDTDQFAVTGPGGTAPASFLFVSEAGDVTGWNRTATPDAAVVVGHVPGAVYKGLALVHTPAGPFLLAADFHHNRIDVYDGRFHRLPLPSPFFHDRTLPRGYAPFNVYATADAVYVSYALRGEGADEVDGAGLGFVDRYTNFGLTVHRIASRGPLNAPWGMAVAPASFGTFAGALLVGNFGDGHLSAYRGATFLGQLRTPTGHPIAIDGLWGILPGTATAGGTNALWFSAGTNDEADGLLGLLTPTP
jgi:uncharacterized protein (TIGR03118 family)